MPCGAGVSLWCTSLMNMKRMKLHRTLCTEACHSVLHNVLHCSAVTYAVLQCTASHVIVFYHGLQYLTSHVVVLSHSVVSCACLH